MEALIESHFRETSTKLWLRCLLLHLLLASSLLTLWTLPAVLSVGIFRYLSSILSFSFLLQLSLVCSSQLLYVTSLVSFMRWRKGTPLTLWRILVVNSFASWWSSLFRLEQQSNSRGLHPSGAFVGADPAAPSVAAQAPASTSAPAAVDSLSQLKEASTLLISDWFSRAVFVAGCTASGALMLPSFVYFWSKATIPLVAARHGVVFGSLVGLLYSSWHQRQQLRYFAFPSLQRHSLFRLKAAVPRASLSAIAIPSIALLLSSLSHSLSSSSPSTPPATATRSLMSALASDWLAASLLVFTWDLGAALVDIVYTHRHYFIYPNAMSITPSAPFLPLLVALNHPDGADSMFHHLAFLNLSELASSAVFQKARAELFDSPEGLRQAVEACLSKVQLLRELSEACVTRGEGRGGAGRGRSQSMAVERGAGMQGTAGLFGVASSVPSQPLIAQGDGSASACLENILNEFQLFAWAATAMAALTKASREEDSLGLLQTSGQNAAILDSLLTTLVAAERLRDTISVQRHWQQRQNSIATDLWCWLFPLLPSSSRTSFIRGHGFVDVRMEAIIDTLLTSIYCIVAAFGSEIGRMKTDQNFGRRFVLEPSWTIVGDDQIQIERCTSKLERIIASEE